VKDIFVADGCHGGKGSPKGCCPTTRSWAKKATSPRSIRSATALGLTLNAANGDIWESEFGPNKAPSEKTKAGTIDPVLFFIPSINPAILSFTTPTNSLNGKATS
jgi:hypothetical protein